MRYAHVKGRRCRLMIQRGFVFLFSLVSSSVSWGQSADKAVPEWVVAHPDGGYSDIEDHAVVGSSLKGITTVYPDVVVEAEDPNTGRKAVVELLGTELERAGLKLADRRDATRSDG